MTTLARVRDCAADAPAGEDVDRFWLLVSVWLKSVKSPESRKAYLSDIRQYHAWCAGLGLEPLTVRRHNLDSYRDHLDEPRPDLRHSRYSNATIARRLTAVSSFYSYVVDEAPELVADNPARKVDRPKAPTRSSTRYLRVDEAERYLDAAADEGPLALALVDLMLSTALRVTEVVAADVTDLEVDGRDTVLRVTRKGDLEDCVLVPAPTAQALYEYLGDRSTGPLFVFRHQGRRPTRQQVGHLVDKIARKAGLYSPGARLVSPHSLRHTAATNALDQPDTDIRKVQALMGHSDPRTTGRYDGAAVEAGRSAARALGDLWHRPRVDDINERV